MALPSRRSSAVQSSTGRVPPTPVTPDPGARTSSPLLAGAGFVLLILWLMAILFRLGELSHVLLLAGLMLLMMAALKARDAAARTALPPESEER